MNDILNQNLQNGMMMPWESLPTRGLALADMMMMSSTISCGKQYSHHLPMTVTKAFMILVELTSRVLMLLMVE